jgi:phage tail sheath gpL-like
MSHNTGLTNNQTTYNTIKDALEVYRQNTYRYNDDSYLQEKTTPQGSKTYILTLNKLSYMSIIPI